MIWQRMIEQATLWLRASSLFTALSPSSFYARYPNFHQSLPVLLEMCIQKLGKVTLWPQAGLGRIKDVLMHHFSYSPLLSYEAAHRGFFF